MPENNKIDYDDAIKNLQGSFRQDLRCITGMWIFCCVILLIFGAVMNY